MTTASQPVSGAIARRSSGRNTTRQVNRRSTRTVLDLLDATTPRLEPANAPDPATAPEGACRHCGSTRLLALTITLTDGTPVAFTSCRTCERRDWTSPDGVLDVPAVLEHARANKPGPAPR